LNWQNIYATFFEKYFQEIFEAGFDEEEGNNSNEIIESPSHPDNPAP